MKRIPILLTLAVLLLAACAPVAQKFVELPDGTRATLTALVVAVVGFAIAKAVTYVPFLAFLLPFREPLGYALSAALIEALQNVLPTAYPEISILAVQLILAIIAALKLFEVLKLRGARFFS